MTSTNRHCRLGALYERAYGPIDPEALRVLYERLLGCGACRCAADTMDLAMRTLRRERPS